MVYSNSLLQKQLKQSLTQKLSVVKLVFAVVKMPFNSHSLIPETDVLSCMEGICEVL